MTKVIVTNVINTGSAFGAVLEGDAAGVFIPARLADFLQLATGDTVDAQLAPNPAHAGRTPWLAVTAKKVVAVEAVSKPKDNLEEMIRKDLSSGAGTAQQIARSIGQPVDLVAAQLRSMDVVHDTIYALSIIDLIDPEDA